VFNANDPAKLDYQVGVGKCAYSGAFLRKKLVCKRPPPA
jgi:hypothetical protein